MAKEERSFGIGDHPETFAIDMPLVMHPLPAAIVFHQQGIGEVGRLEYGPPMHFEGNIEESARIFLDVVCQLWNEREQA